MIPHWAQLLILTNIPPVVVATERLASCILPEAVVQFAR